MDDSPLPVLPSPGQLVQIARERLAAELASLPSTGSPKVAGWIAATGEPGTISLGALAHFIGQAASHGDLQHARDLFVVLVSRIEARNRFWATRVARLAGGDLAQRRDDLLQDLTLHLWRTLTGGSVEPWELFFSRSLEFAQRHLARALLAAPARSRTAMITSLDDLLERFPATTCKLPGIQQTQDEERIDLFTLVEALPAGEREVIVLRYWYGASEQQIAAALGGVTTRTVRTRARQALNRLRGWYVDEGVPA